MKTLLILTILAVSHGTVTLTQWFETPTACEAELAKQQAKPEYVNGTCVELVKPIKQSVEAAHG